MTTSDPELDRLLRMYRDHGSDRRYHHIKVGFNSRMDEIQAAVLRVKLRRLDAWNAQRRRHARRYDELLADAAVGLPEALADRQHVFYVYVVRSPWRDRLQAGLAEQGVQTGIHFPIPIHLQPASADLGCREGDLPITERAAREVLSLPMYAELTDAQIEYVAHHVSALSAAVADPLGV